MSNEKFFDDVDLGALVERYLALSLKENILYATMIGSCAFSELVFDLMIIIYVVCGYVILESERLEKVVIYNFSFSKMFIKKLQGL